jgi:hypothetical protein
MKAFERTVLLVLLAFGGCGKQEIGNSPVGREEVKAAEPNRYETHDSASTSLPDAEGSQSNELPFRNRIDPAVEDATKGGVEPDVSESPELPNDVYQSRLRELADAISSVDFSQRDSSTVLGKLWEGISAEAGQYRRIGDEEIVLRLGSRIESRDLEMLVESISPLAESEKAANSIVLRKYLLITSVAERRPDFLINKLKSSAAAKTLDDELTLLAFLAASDDVASRSNLALEDIEILARSQSVLAKGVAEAVHSNYAPRGLEAESMGVEEYKRKLLEAHNGFRQRYGFAQER